MKFIKHLINLNRAKVFIIIFLSIAVTVFYTVDEKVTHHDKVTEYTSDGEYYYTYMDNGDHEIVKFEEELKTCYVPIVHENFHTFLMGLIGLCVFILLIPIVTSDQEDNGGWDINRCVILTLYDKVESFYEDKWYYYRLNGRLLLKENYKESKTGILREIGYFREDPTPYPIYDGPLSHRRSKKIETILNSETLN